MKGSKEQIILLFSSERRSRLMTFFMMVGGTALLACSLSFGQLPQTGSESPLESYKKLTKPTQVQPKPLEGVIDPSEYILGPGDQLEMVVWGGIEVSFNMTVSPDGSISVPNVGILKVAGLTVADAEKLLVGKSRKIYPKAQVSLRLIEIRSMMVSISGAVVSPGVYGLTSVDRLSTLISGAGGLVEKKTTKPSDQDNKTDAEASKKSKSGKEAEKKLESLEKELSPSLRKFTITTRTGETTNVDFLRYQRTGDLKYNPVLRDGDQVHIPCIDSEVGVIQIFGAVKIPGEYEFVAGDRLLTIIELAGGFRADALLSDIRIVRFNEDNLRTHDFSVDLNWIGEEEVNPALNTDDRIFVRKYLDYRPKFQVEINGEVKFPGIYPIENDITRLTELVEMSGGFTERANLGNAIVVRMTQTEIDDPEYERLTQIPFAHMTEMEFRYFKSRTLDELPHVIVDFQKLFRKNDARQDITLRDGDIIEIPTLTPTVNVIGKVMYPGLVKYEPSENFEYYIREVGGYSWNARKSRMLLVKADSGVWVKLKSNTKIEIGDTIFIPEKRETDWWLSFKDVLMVVSQLATIFAVIISVSR